MDSEKVSLLGDSAPSSPIVSVVQPLVQVNFEQLRI